MRRSVPNAAVLAFAMPCLVGVALAQPTASRKTVLRTGQSASMVAPDLTFGNLAIGGSGIADNGHVAVLAAVTGDGVTFNNDDVILTGPPDALTLVARQADPAPGTPAPSSYGAPSINHFAFPEVVFDVQGELAFLGYTFVNGQWQETLFAGPTGTPGYIAAEFNAAPDITPAANLVQLGTPIAATAQALVAWRGLVSGVGDVIYTTDEFSQIAWITEADTPPGFAPGTGWAFNDGVLINELNEIAFVATLSSPIPASQRRCLYAGLPTLLSLVARQGNPTPDLPATTYGDLEFERVRIADDRVIAFSAPVSGASTGAIFLGLFDDVRLFAFDGMQAPDLPAGVTLQELGEARVELNGNAELAFNARLAGPGVDATNDSAIFEGPPNDLRLRAREGDPAAEGGLVGELRTGLPYLAYNDQRQIVFLDTAGAYMGTTPNGALVEFARAASLFVADDGFTAATSGASWTATWLEDTGSTEDGRASAFNNSGQFIAPIRFSGANGSGVFIFRALDPPCSPGDVTSDGACEPGVPDGAITLSDFSCYLSLWAASDPLADITATGLCDPGTGGDGVDLSDFSCYLSLWAAGCP